MGMKYVFNPATFILLSIFVASAATACTTISFQSGETVLLGGNEDSAPTAASFLVADNRGTLGVVYFATPWEPWPLVMMSGMNEAGLSYHTNSIPAEKLHPGPEKKAGAEWPVTILMREAACVEEVLQRIFTYNWGDSMAYQVHFADQSGDAAVICPGPRGELTIKRKSKAYLVSTNFNLARPGKHRQPGTRYDTANRMLTQSDMGHPEPRVFLASVLNATQQNSFTIYSFIYDLGNLKIHLYYGRQYDAPYVLDLDKELAKTTGIRKVALKDLISGRNNQ